MKRSLIIGALAAILLPSLAVASDAVDEAQVAVPAFTRFPANT